MDTPGYSGYAGAFKETQVKAENHVFWMPDTVYKFIGV
jgi:hypothetical protein